MKLTHKQIWASASIGIAVLTLGFWLRDAQPSSDDTKTMQTFTRQMKTYCVGRFLIEAPGSATDASGVYETQIAGVEVKAKVPRPAADLVGMLDAELSRREAELRSLPPTRNGGSRFKSIRRVGQLGRVIHYLTPDSDTAARLEGHVPRDGGVFLFKTSSYDEGDVKEFADFLEEVEPHLSLRADDDIPKTSGFCIDGGFIATNPKKGENADWGWSLPGIRMCRLASAAGPIAKRCRRASSTARVRF